MGRGGNGKGLLIHCLTDAARMPLANGTTAANGNERAQVLPRLDAVRLRTGQPGRPRKRPKVLATDKGYNANALRLQLRTRGIRAQRPKRVWKTKKAQGRPIKMEVPRFLPGGAHVSLVSGNVPPLGPSLGTAGGLLHGVSGYGHDPYLDPKIDSGIDS